ncbi:unnamed protein product [Durusdinium trenchii]|uniref:Uncharacterized protein n=1 Tax=Durusdinium trenchii TaxID=1381693 RepID=A0ABP0NB00_9DINO
MGCLSCAKGRFLKAHPFLYPLWAQPEDPIFNEEYRLVVADTCPHRGNEAWCPGADGRANHFGVKDHFDFAAPPPKFDAGTRLVGGGCLNPFLGPGNHARSPWE